MHAIEGLCAVIYVLSRIELHIIIFIPNCSKTVLSFCAVWNLAALTWSSWVGVN